MSQRVKKELQGTFDGEKVGHSRMHKQLCGFRAEEARWILGRLLKGRRDLNKAFVTHIREQ